MGLISQLSRTKQDIHVVERENETLKQDLNICKQEMERIDKIQLEAETYSRQSNFQISGPGLSKDKVGFTNNRLISVFRYVFHSLGRKHVAPIKQIYWLRGSDSIIIIRFKLYSDREDFWNEPGHFSN